MSNKFIYKKASTKVVSEHDISRFTEYHLPFTKVAVGISEINGQYPLSGYDVDTVVEQVWYVESGQGVIWLQGLEHEIAEGDMIQIPANEKYWIKGDNLKLVVSSSPPWFAEQHQHME